MAKTVKCAFCGKELVSGFFKGEEMYLDLGNESIVCCESCHRHYVMSKQETKRFAAKLHNYKKTNGKRRLSEEELVKLYQIYFEEMNAYQARNAQAGELDSLGYFYCNDDGYFCITEYALGSIISSGDMAKAIDRMEEAPICAFNAGDISRLEYRLTDKLGADTGKALTTAYPFEIRLNDPREMTYKPCVMYIVATGTAFLPHVRKQKAEESVLSVLSVLRRATGTRIRIAKAS